MKLSVIIFILLFTNKDLAIFAQFYIYTTRTTVYLNRLKCIQNTDSAERERCIGWEGLRANLLRGNFSKQFCNFAIVVNNFAKSGRFSAWYDQQSIKMS